jgi:hypothetical protein
MKNLKDFQSNEIELNAANNIKGGIFCEWYINQRTSSGKQVNSGQLAKAMELDNILYTQDMDAALAAGGDKFQAKYA